MLRVKTQNKKGGEPKWNENIGYVAGFESDDTYVVLDNYEGHGESYKQRECAQIRIQNNGRLLFIGTFDELQLKLNVQS